MGKTLMGGATHEGNVSQLTPEQQQIFSQLLSQVGPQAGNLLGQIGTGGPSEDVFQKYFVDPAQRAFSQQIAPSIQQRFVDANAGASSALNQALAQGAADVSSQIGTQYGQFQQNYNSQQLQALQQLLGLVTGQTFSPIVSQQQGLLGPLVGAAGQIGAAYVGA